ncbi:hypothetical protein A2U01_0115194, partial [Trifolium medium]|nr:hypothetical protein [Trifolium medium]
ERHSRPDKVQVLAPGILSRGATRRICKRQHPPPHPGRHGELRGSPSAC